MQEWTLLLKIKNKIKNFYIFFLSKITPKKCTNLPRRYYPLKISKSQTKINDNSFLKNRREKVYQIHQSSSIFKKEKFHLNDSLLISVMEIIKINRIIISSTIDFKTYGGCPRKIVLLNFILHFSYWSQPVISMSLSVILKNISFFIDNLYKILMVD